MAQHFDVAIVGAQPAGVMAATMLAKKGRRVLLVDNGEDAVGYQRRGLRLPFGPSIVPTFENSPAVRRVHDELGITPELRAKVTPASPSMQTLLPKHRLGFQADRSQPALELKAEFPDQAENIDAFFTELFTIDEQISWFLGAVQPLKPQGIFELFKVKRELGRVRGLDVPADQHSLFARFPAHHPIREALLGPLRFLSYLHTDTITAFAAIRLLANSFRGLLKFEERTGGLEGFLWRAARTAGVEIHRNAEVVEFVVRGRKLERLVLSDDKTNCTADYFIAATYGPFSELLPSGARASKFAQDEQAVQARSALLLLNMIVSRDVIPCGMGENVFVLNGRRAARGDEGADMPMLLQRSALRNEANALATSDNAQDLELLTAAAPVRTADVLHTPARFAQLRTQLFERVARVIPYLRDHVRDTSLPTDTTSWDIEQESQAKRLDPWRVHPIFEVSNKPFLGVSARGPKTYYKNLLRCGAEIAPGLGLEGEYISAVAVTDTIFKLAGKRWRARA